MKCKGITIMPSSKMNRIALYVSAFLVIALVLFAILRDNADQITLNQANKLLSSKVVNNVVITKQYVYLKTKDNVYKIASSQVNPQMFVDYKVEVDGSANIVVYLLFGILLLGIGSLIFRWWQKRGDEPFNLISKNQNSSTIDV